MTEIRGLPAHVLLVHALVIIIPVAAVMLIVAAWWPRGRKWLGALTPIAALIALVLVPITTNAGEWLRDRVGNSPLIERHADLGEQLLPWVIGMFGAALIVFGAHWYYARRDPSATSEMPIVLRVGVGIAATAVAVGAIVQTVRIGESGSKAVWTGCCEESQR